MIQPLQLVLLPLSLAVCLPVLGADPVTCPTIFNNDVERLAYLRQERSVVISPCVDLAIKGLEDLERPGAKETIITYLDYRRKMTKGDHVSPRLCLFPAKCRLFGKETAVPLLVDLLGGDSASELARANAREVLLTTYEYHQEMAVRILVRASRDTSNSAVGARLFQAALKLADRCFLHQKEACAEVLVER